MRGVPREARLWTTLNVRDGEQGPLVTEVIHRRV